MCCIPIQDKVNGKTFIANTVGLIRHSLGISWFTELIRYLLDDFWEFIAMSVAGVIVV